MMQDQFIIFLLLKLLLLVSWSEGQSLSVDVFPKKIDLSIGESVSFDVVVTNGGNEELRIFGLLNDWHRIPVSLLDAIGPPAVQDQKGYLRDVDSMLYSTSESIGFVAVLLDSAGRHVPWLKTVMHKVGEVRVFHEKTTSEQLLFLDSLERRAVEEQKSKNVQIRKSEVKLKPGQQVRCKLSIDFVDNFKLKKGALSSLFIYYVVNKRVFDIVRKEANPWLGCVRSNEVKLVYH